MLSEYRVEITETITRAVWVTADDPMDAQRVAEENYREGEVTNVSFEADPSSRRLVGDR